MNIKVNSVDRKLTKTLIKQMPKGEHFSVLDNCEEVLGYFLGIVKGSYKSVLIKSQGEYYIISTNWIKGNNTIYRKINGTSFSESLPFAKKEKLDSFWDKLQNILSQAKNHIYI